MQYAVELGIINRNRPNLDYNIIKVKNGAGPGCIMPRSHKKRKAFSAKNSV